MKTHSLTHKKRIRSEKHDKLQFPTTTKVVMGCHCYIAKRNQWIQSLKDSWNSRHKDDMIAKNLPHELQMTLKIHKFHISRLKKIAKNHCKVARWFANSIINCLSVNTPNPKSLPTDWLNTISVMKNNDLYNQIFSNVKRSINIPINYDYKTLLVTIKPCIRTGRWHPDLREYKSFTKEKLTRLKRLITKKNTNKKKKKKSKKQYQKFPRYRGLSQKLSDQLI